MDVIFTSAALNHLEEWRKSGNKNIQHKIKDLIDAIRENPFEGIGKPEALKHQLSGKWSRIINQEHRVIYTVVGDTLNIYSLKGHY